MLTRLHILFVPLVLVTQSLYSSDRPNIVWITTEDNSPNWLRIYDSEKGASMPNVERLAEHGIVFNNAFSNAPVCSVARSTLLSGCYTVRTGANNHRNSFEVPFPDGLKSYPEYFRDAGYYTANCHKEDYNYQADGIWDDSSKTASYRNRKPGQPFFQVWSFHDTHESRMHSKLDQRKVSELTTSPDEVEIFPYHPDTALFRKSYAYYYDKHHDDDVRIGKVLDQLVADGLMDDTIIFYYGDHGGVLPRSKAYVYESGLHVPLVVYIPQKWEHLFPVEVGSRVDGFVSFVDFAPTVLNLAGIPVPEQMDGVPFLGENVKLDELNSRDETFGHADRFDEKTDMVRSFRKGQYKYIRSYQPYNIDGHFHSYRYMMAAYREWKELYEAGELDPVQAAFFEPREPEALYDLAKDPHETVNLANDSKFESVLESMRDQLTAKLKQLPDLSFFPEPYLQLAAADNPVQFGQHNQAEIGNLIDIANLQLIPFDKARSKIKKALSSKYPWQRYWGYLVCSRFGTEAEEFVNYAKTAFENDDEILVRLRAAEFLSLMGAIDTEKAIESLANSSHRTMEISLILNTASLLKTIDPSLEFHFNESQLLQSAGNNKNKMKWIQRRIEFLKASD